MADTFADDGDDDGDDGDDGPAPASKGDREQFTLKLGDAVARSGGFEESDLYENGVRRPLSQIVAMAKVSGVWRFLSDSEKMQYTDSSGQLANNRPYLARKTSFAPALQKNTPFVINASGARISVDRG